MAEPLFDLGRVVVTRGALGALGADEMVVLLARHQRGDWGELGDEDRAENDLSVREGFRLLSAYVVRGRKVWVLTEATREATTILLPEEY